MQLEKDSEPIFLIQLPSYVVEQWKQEKGTRLARLTVQGDEVPSVSLTLEGDYAKDLPKNFTGTVTLGEMKLFEEVNSSTEGEEPSATMLPGAVFQINTRVQMRTLNPKTGKMEVDKNVLRLAREKDAEEKRKAKALTAQEISYAAGRTRRATLPSIKTRKQLNQLYPSHKRKNADRRVCEEQNYVEALLFDLFEEQEKWKLMSLQMRTKQPMVYLKQVLSGIADLIHSGPEAGMYQLKPEFHRNKKTNSTPAADQLKKE